MADSISQRYSSVLEKVNDACVRSGRKKDEVSLIVVTKGFDEKKVLEVIDAGAKNLGENYPEETVRKIQAISETNPEVKPVWHMIGHLQSRKIKLMYPAFSMIHSVDSLELAKKLDQYYSDIKQNIDVLIEVNIAGEQTKYGFDISTKKSMVEFWGIMDQLLLLKNLKIKGLMTMPPYALKEGQNKRFYDSCKNLLDGIRDKFKKEDFLALSMGTSADYSTAIECGATMVRVGEAIMGKRNYSN